MTRRRWIADEVTTDRAALTGPHAEHLARVLRAQVGQEFEIATGSGVRLGRIVSVQAGRIEFALGQDVPEHSLPPVSLILSIFKFDRMEWAIEKCTELGAARIVPAISRRTEAHLAAASAKRWQRWQRVARQAAEQSRRALAPEILSPLPLSKAVAQEAGVRIVLSEFERNLSLKDALPSDASANEVILALGPEGGWTADELKLFHESNWTAASLGPTILRAETAAIAALAIAMAEVA
jgi:16S rRNA (uracil1498-N3)-methyltransferase